MWLARPSEGRTLEPSETISRNLGDRLLLGFDAGCTTCSDLASRVGKVVGDKLEIRSLHDPQVDRWRKQVLGENAPWAPTLVEVKDGKVGAWTGIRIGAHLGRVLGPVTAWRVMQALGEVGVARKTEGYRAGELVEISRSRFLKAMGGAAVAFSALSGFAFFTSAATAREIPSVSEGTPEQRRWAQRTVRSSREFRASARESELGFDFGRARFAFDESADTAAVVVPTEPADSL